MEGVAYSEWIEVVESRGSGFWVRGSGEEELGNGVRDGTDFESRTHSRDQWSRRFQSRDQWSRGVHHFPQEGTVTTGRVDHMDRLVAKMLLNEVADRANDELHERTGREIRTAATTGRTVQLAEVEFQQQAFRQDGLESLVDAGEEVYGPREG